MYDIYPMKYHIFGRIQVFGKAPLTRMTVTMSITFEPTCDLQQCGTLTCVDSGDSVYPHLKLIISK